MSNYKKLYEHIGLSPSELDQSTRFWVDYLFEMIMLSGEFENAEEVVEYDKNIKKMERKE